MRSSLPLLAAVLAFAPLVLRAADAAPAVAAEEIAKIEGIEIARSGGGFLGIKTEGVVLKVTFYDEKKKPVAADAVRIAARWQDSRQRRTVLLPATPETLVSPSVISRPFNYIIYLVLIGPDEKEIETHSLSLNGS
ncbi:MAG: hypothetical protein H7067_08030 [Burkholderiales bacterium]|nr:hypothetical protein [Opitutaceae bacterium]